MKLNNIVEAALNDQNKITVTMDMLKWCRLEDVLCWLRNEVLYFQSLGILVTDLADGKPITIVIPADQYTASVIARSFHYTGNRKIGYWKIVYRPDIDCIVAHDNVNDINSDDTHWCITNPDPIGNVTEWSGEWLIATLKEIV